MNTHWLVLSLIRLQVSLCVLFIINLFFNEFSKLFNSVIIHMEIDFRKYILYPPD